MTEATSKCIKEQTVQEQVSVRLEILRQRPEKTTEKEKGPVGGHGFRGYSVRAVEARQS